MNDTYASPRQTTAPHAFSRQAADEGPMVRNLGVLLTENRGKAAEMVRRVEVMASAVEGARPEPKDTNGVGRPDSMRGTAEDTYHELCKLETALERLARALGV